MADSYAIRGLRYNLNRERAEKLLSIQLKNTFDQLPNKFPNWEKDRDELFHLISTQGCPNEYFDFLSRGSFKETYMFHHTHNYVVKFCSQQNNTETEKALLDAAHAEGLGYAFIPTYFVNFYGLTCGMPIMVDEYNDGSNQNWDSEYSTWVDNEDWEGRYATDLEIQPILDHIVTSDPGYEHWNFDYAYGEDTTYIKGAHQKPDHQLRDPAIDPNTGKIIPHSVIYDLDIDNKRWIEEFVRFYGLDGLTNLANFVQKYHVTDLHNRNLGYIAAKDGTIRPVIVDWLSCDKGSIEEIRTKGESDKKDSELH